MHTGEGDSIGDEKADSGLRVVDEEWPPSPAQSGGKPKRAGCPISLWCCGFPFPYDGVSGRGQP
eukprot:1797459-Rhodomonas_salina.4